MRKLYPTGGFGNKKSYANSGGMIAHAFGGAYHTADTIAHIQTRVSDGFFYTTAAAEFYATPAKTTPVANDILLIEDSADTRKKKAISAGSLAGLYIQNQAATPGTAQTANFNITGSGIVATAMMVGDVTLARAIHSVSSNALLYNILNVERHNASNLEADVYFVRSRGTLASPIALQNGDYIGSLNFVGYGNVLSRITGAVIKAFVDGVVTDSAVPSAISFTTMNSAGTRQEVARMNSSAFVGVGTDSPATRLHVSEASALSPRGIMSSQHSGDTSGARFHLRKSRGTNAAPSVVVTGDMLGRVVASGYDGANYLEMAGIDINCEGTIAANRIPTRITFLTATDANPSVLTQRMIIDSSGKIGLGGAIDASYTINITGTLHSTGSIVSDGSLKCPGGYLDAAGVRPANFVSSVSGSTMPIIQASGGGGSAPFNVPGNLFISAACGIASPRSVYVYLGNPAVLHTTFLTGGNTGHGVLVPTALVHIAAGTATASTAPLKFTSGVSLTNPEAGTIEFTTDNLYFTITTGTARKGFVFDNGTSLTSGRIPYATTNGRLTDSSSLTYDGTAALIPNVYGSMYADEASITVTVSVSNTYYQVASGITGGLQNGCTFQNSKEVKVLYAGNYLVRWSMSVNCGSNSQDIAGCVMHGGVAQTNTTNHQYSNTGASKNVSISGTGIITCAADDLLSLAVANHTAANNLVVEHINFTVNRVG
jgi:hypothetical protein